MLQYLQAKWWWRHNGHDGVSIHQPHHCLLNRLLGCRSKKTSKLRVTGLCTGNSLGTGEFPAQMASNVETVSIWWRYHGFSYDSHVYTWNWCLKVITFIWMFRHLKSQATWVFLQQLDYVENKENTKVPHNWPFVRRIHQWPVDFPVMWKVCPCPDIFLCYFLLQSKIAVKLQTTTSVAF